MPPMTTSREYLEAYDRQLRTDAETPSAIAVERLGPLRLMTFAGGQGFVTYQDLGGAGAVTIAGWVREALAHYRADAAITRVEWKTRGHDRAPGLHDALVSSGFAPDEPESIMIGEARRLAAGVAVPDEVGLREVTSEPDVRAMCAMQAEVFGDPYVEDTANAVLRRLATADGMQLWVAEAGGQIVSTGRLEPVAGTEFAGIWGGATRPEWRGRGIYRALTAARARSALGLGKRLMHSDSTEFSRPILERAGWSRSLLRRPTGGAGKDLWPTGRFRPDESLRGPAQDVNLDPLPVPLNNLPAPLNDPRP
jgi:ribosomal protein S18 acetylase RimI-like enzyme